MLQDFQRGKKLVAEVALPAADAGERRGRAQHRPLAAQRAVIGLHAPDRGDGVAVDAIFALDDVKDLAVFGDERAALRDAVGGHQQVKIIPDRFCEFGLAVEQVHDAQVGRKPSRQGGVGVARNAVPRRQRRQAVEALAEIRRRRANSVRGHAGIARCAGLAAPRHRRHRLYRRDRRRKRSGQARIALCAALRRSGGAQHGRDQRRAKADLESAP